MLYLGNQCPLVIFSKRLQVFVPLDIKMIVSLPGLKEREIYQMTINPAAEYNVGFFNKQGSGTCYYRFKDKKATEFMAPALIENTHFIFI